MSPNVDLPPDRGKPGDNFLRREAGRPREALHKRAHAPAPARAPARDRLLIPTTLRFDQSALSESHPAG